MAMSWVQGKVGRSLFFTIPGFEKNFSGFSASVSNAVSGAASVAGNFSKNDRIANGLGIPVDPMVLKATEDIRTELGLNDMGSAVNTFRHH